MNKTYKFKKDMVGPFKNEFKRGSVVQILRGAVYQEGYPIPPYMQTKTLEWINNNVDSLIDVK